MMLRKPTIAIPALLALCGGLLSVAGCGGGATGKPKITARPTAGGAKAKTGEAGNGGKKKGPAGGSGSLSGAIVLVGAPPAPVLESITKDDYCIAKMAMIFKNVLEVDKTSKGIKNVIIYLKTKPAGAAPARTDKKQYDNKDCQFEPRVLAVQVGQPIEIRNLDGTAHNTKVSTLNNEQVDSKLSAKKGGTIDVSTIKYEFREDSPLGVGCAFHPWMSGVHRVFDHPFFAQTDKDGKFEIKNIPAGKHTIIVWHEKKGQLLEKEVTIEKDKATPFNEKIDSAKLAGFAPRPAKTVVLNFKR